MMLFSMTLIFFLFLTFKSSVVISAQYGSTMFQNLLGASFLGTLTGAGAGAGSAGFRATGNMGRSSTGVSGVSGGGGASSTD